jgi:urease accessory protein
VGSVGNVGGTRDLGSARDAGGVAEVDGVGGVGNVGWTAALELGFAADADTGATRLAHRAHRGPFVVQRPLLPEGPDLCHVYLLHPPGGLVGGDELRLDLRVGPDAQALITTPAAGKVYRTLGPTARQTNVLSVEAGGSLEWLPQEIIVFDGAAATIDTRVELGPGARFIGAETICFGLAARGERFARGSCRQRFEIWRGGQPLFIERGQFDGGGAVHQAPWGLAGATVLSLLVAAPAPEPVVVETLRQSAAALQEPELAAFTVLGDGELLVARYRGDGAERARNFVHTCWRTLRPALLGRPAVAPRIWAT